MIPVVRACYRSKYRTVIVVTGSQMGKSESLYNIAGHRLADDPVPVLYIGPTRSNVEKVMEPRFMQMVRQSAELKKRYQAGKQNSKTRKLIGGVSFRFAWAGSATELASDPAGLVFVDERDRMPGVSGEGDPMELADARRMTYADSTLVGTSTPTLGNVEPEWDEETKLERWKLADPEDVASPIWKRWQEGTRFEWAWPCPHCGEYFIPRFSLLKWKENATPNEALKTALMHCRVCGAGISDTHKTEMNARGVYVGPGQAISRNGEVTGPEIETDTASFWASGLCSPWQTFGQRAKKFLAAVRSKDPERVQAAVNTDLGELFRTGGQAPDWQLVWECRRPYKLKQLPVGAYVIFMSVDVQKDRLYFVVRAWGHANTSWLVDKGEIFGETQYDEVWSKLGRYRDVRYGDMKVQACFVDSGYRPGDKFKRPDNMIYKFARRHMGWAFATKGHDSQDKPIKMTKIDITLDGKTMEQGLQLWHIDTDHFKSWVHARIEWPDDEAGGWHLPDDVDEDYCRQVVSEAKVVKPSGQIVWTRLRKDNHFLDCFDKQTEVLTREGWKFFTELSYESEIATVNLETDQIEYQRPTAAVSRQHDGPMVRIHGKRVDALVTPNHRMVTYRKKAVRSVTPGKRQKWVFDGPPEITLAGKLDCWHRLKLTAQWTGSDADSVVFPAVGREPEVEVASSDWAEFLGWYVSEGHRTVKGRSYGVFISQNPGAKQNRIRGLLGRLPWKFSGKRQMATRSAQLFSALDDCYTGNGLGKACYQKKVPRWIKNASSKTIRVFLEAAVAGDGWTQGDFRTYATTSRALADGMQESFLKTGNSANIKAIQPPPCRIGGRVSPPSAVQYLVSETKTASANLRRSDNTELFSEVHYTGPVYCVTVPNGTMIVRRNGRPIVAGNCEMQNAAMADYFKVWAMTKPAPPGQSETDLAAIAKLLNG